MGRYRNGWCGSCGCNSCDCSCGRRTVLQQSVSSCGSSSSRTNFCTEPVIYLTSNLIILAAGTEMEIKVSNSTYLYAGQGIQIGDYYFQITEIVDSTTVNIMHNGTATPGGNLTAINATYGCYQYPIYYVGIVELAVDEVEAEGLDAAFDPVADSLTNVDADLTYGYLGPNNIHFNLEMTVDIANAPDFISIPLPNADSAPTSAFSAIVIYDSVPSILVAYKSGSDLIIGPGGGTAFTNDTEVIIKVSGEYELV